MSCSLQTAWREQQARRPSGSDRSPGDWVFNRMLQEYPLLVDALGASKPMHARTLTEAFEMAMESLDCLGAFASSIAATC